MGYSPIFDLVGAGVLVYFGWLFHQLIAKTIQIYAAKEKYVALYDLKKLEIELDKRKLSFEELDAFGVRFAPEKKFSRNRLREVDDDYGIESVSFDSKKAK